MTRDARIHALDLASGAVEDVALPESSRGIRLVDWLPDGRIAYIAHGERLLIARPGDAAFAEIPLGAGEWPIGVRPDGGAALCLMAHWGWIYTRWGGVVRHADGRAVDVWEEGPTAEIAVWMPAPGLVESTTR
jgi:hypothetical protein